jgi:hypothetical protein
VPVEVDVVSVLSHPAMLSRAVRCPSIVAGVWSRDAGRSVVAGGSVTPDSALFADDTIEELSGRIQVARVTGILLQDVHQRPGESRAPATLGEASTYRRSVS